MRAAFGFRPHTGWAAVVAVAGDPRTPTVVHRARLELADGDLPMQPYHAAAGLDRDRAATLIRRAEESARRCAGEGLAGLASQVESAGHRLVAAGLPVSTAVVPPSLDRILASHMLWHAAEGDLFQQVLADAADHRGLAVYLVPADDLTARARRLFGRGDAELRARLTELGKPLGPPWTRDQKDATLAACLALDAAPEG
jgi:hypothetical protein